MTVSIPYFDGRTSALSYPTLTNSFSVTFLYLEIRPSAANGIILLNTQLNGPDFIAIALRGGRVELWYDLGQEAFNITSVEPVTLNAWHSIQVTRSGRDGELMVDSMPAVTGTSPGSFTMLQINSELYLGTAPTPISLPLQLKSLSGFQGCVRQLRTARLTTTPTDLIGDATSGRGITECPDLQTCDTLSCMNGGTCINTIDNFMCECEVGFTGERCEVDLCEVSNPCQNNGVCFAETGGSSGVQLRCNCSAPFTGENCTESKFAIINKF